MNRDTKTVDAAEMERQNEFCEEVRRTRPEKKYVFIRTFGCQQNEADSERMAWLCEKMGYEKCDEPEKAKLILVNTCAVREHAEKKALSIIGQYKHIKDADPDVVIGVGGCMVTQGHRADKLKNSYPYVSFVFDTGSLHKLPELVYGALMKKGRRIESCEGEFLIPEGIGSKSETPFSVWLSIMYGCNNFCSYCIVPYARGRERSRTPEAVLEEARRLIDGGAKEITLLGQNVNSYGNDAGFDCSFASLARAVCALDGDFRVRFMTSHPKDVTDELIEVFASEKKMIKHFHLPLQSGSDAILKKMNRHYDTARYMSVVEKLKSAVPDVSLTSDIIVGFPGETDADFEATMDALSAVGYDMIFSFIYSPRIGTPAAEMEGQIPHEVSTARFERMIEMQNDISRRRNERFVGRTVRALVTKVSRTDGDMLTARSDSPRPIHFAGEKELIGEFADIRITRADTFSLIGETVK
jgi:tRNA-2-methylthio-N6-dimethylallyladenosine synthase